MAAEWTRADIHRVMLEQADTEGNVSLAQVRQRFNLQGHAKFRKFDTLVDCLIGRGLYQPINPMSGVVRT